MLKTPENQQSKEVSDDEDDDTQDESDGEDEVHDNPDDIITLNVGGIRHETRLQTLRKYTRKTTRLSEVADIAEKMGKKEFYFDRQPEFFPFILNFYRSGKLHLPLNMCGMILKEELKYWMIDDKDIEQCCWVHYIKYEETHGMLEMFDQDEKHNRLATKRIKADASRFERIRPKLWRFLQDPYSSKGATVYAVISLLIVILSITVVMVETLPYFGSIYAHSKSDKRNFTSEELKDAMNIFKTATTPLSILLIVDNICNIYFLCELMLKFIAAPYKRRFLITPFTLIEFACLIPYYVAVTIVFIHPDPIDVFDIVRLLLALRVMRIFRIFILMKHFMALKVLMYTMKASTNELFLLLLVVILGVVIFACLVYYMEIFSDEDSDFQHIPLAFWWALITMTTVGYGDMTPSTGLGYAVGSLCAISGVLVIALSVPAIVQNFTLFYTHAQSRSKLKQRKRKYRQARWTRITELLRDKMGHSEKPSLLNIVKLAQNNKLRRKTVFIPPSTSNGHAPQPRDQRSHSVAESLTKRDVSMLLQKHNTDLNNGNVSEKTSNPSEEKKTKFPFPDLKIKRNQVASATVERQNSENENLDKKERRKSSSSSNISESDITSPKSVRWAVQTDGVKTSKNINSKDLNDEVDSAVIEIHSPATSLPTLQEDDEADISNSENENNDNGESPSGLKRVIRHDTKYRNNERESESPLGADREEKRRRKSSDKEKRTRKTSDSEYESSSGKDDDLLDEAYEEMRFVHRNSIISMETEEISDEHKLSRSRSNSIN